MFRLRRHKQRSGPIPGLRWDLHAHLLPGVDDGVRSTEEALEAIQALQMLGYGGCIVTPHIYKDLYDNSREQLERAFEQLTASVAAHNIDFKLRLAAEYFGDEHLIRLAEAGELLSFGPLPHRHVLLEFPYIGEPMYWSDALSVLTRQGYRPVIAHPERYRYVGADLDKWLAAFENYPVLYQCDIGSFVGQYGQEAFRTVRALLRRRNPTFWGTDLHRPSQAERFIRPALEEITRVTEGINVVLDATK